MERNSFEQQAQKKLANREIKPAAQAWDRLDAMLSVQEKPKKTFNWWAIAASFTGLLVMGTLFFNQKKESNPTKAPQEIVLKMEEDKSSAATNVASKIPKNNIIQPKSIAVTSFSNSKNNSKIALNKVVSETSINDTNPVIAEKNPENQPVAILAENPVEVPVSSPKSQKIQVNSATLLSQVDGELELSFREKVISKVNKNYQTVKVALANRNNQE